MILIYPVFLVPKLGWFTKYIKICFKQIKRKRNIRKGRPPSELSDDDDEEETTNRAKQNWVLGIRRLTTQVNILLCDNYNSYLILKQYF